MGEAQEEIRQALVDLRKAAVDIVTLGQFCVRASIMRRWRGGSRRPSSVSGSDRREELGLRMSSPARGALSYYAETQARRRRVSRQIRRCRADVPAPAEVSADAGAAAAETEGRLKGLTLEATLRPAAVACEERKAAPAGRVFWRNQNAQRCASK